jgi:hypothetical protein
MGELGKTCSITSKSWRANMTIRHELRLLCHDRNSQALSNISKTSSSETPLFHKTAIVIIRIFEWARYVPIIPTDLYPAQEHTLPISTAYLATLPRISEPKPNASKARRQWSHTIPSIHSYVCVHRPNARLKVKAFPAKQHTP